MTKADIIESAEQFILNSEMNRISADVALDSGCVGMQIYDAPLLAFGLPSDDLFEDCKKSAVVGEHFITPLEWLSTAKTVISIFFPYKQKIKAGNSTDFSLPSNEWLHARNEGHQLLVQTLQHLQEVINSNGYACIIPSREQRVNISNEGLKPTGSFTVHTSKWSERHVGFICGLGTFSLSKGLITSKGVCGRIGSLITDLELEITNREYTDIYEYCTMCGACITHCPANAISFSKGKEHPPCAEFLERIIKKHGPRSGCGKCQVKVPCESHIPPKNTLA